MFFIVRLEVKEFNLYQILVTQHDASDDVIGVQMWNVDKMPDPQELADDVFNRFGECFCVLVSVNLVDLPFPIYVVLVEGNHDGKQN